MSQNNDLGEIYTFQLTSNWLFKSLVGTSTTVFIWLHVVQILVLGCLCVCIVCCALLLSLGVVDPFSG